MKVMFSIKGGYFPLLDNNRDRFGPSDLISIVQRLLVDWLSCCDAHRLIILNTTG